jgi:hypothetical protein
LLDPEVRHAEEVRHEEELASTRTADEAISMPAKTTTIAKDE